MTGIVKKRSAPRRGGANKRSPGEGDRIIGQRMRARRLEQHVTQAALGDRIGVSFQQVQKYERGDNRISISRLAQVAEILDTNVDYFIAQNGDNGAPHSSKVAEFMATKDGIAIAEEMLRMPNPEMRRSVIALCRAINTHIRPPPE
jgi:transcriptional regulator with XRE-family HTH domain